MEQEISGISKRPGKKTGEQKFFETNLQKISVLFDFEPEFPEILVEQNAPRNSILLSLLRLGIDKTRNMEHPGTSQNKL